MAGCSNARPPRASGYALGGAAPAAGRRLPGQRAGAPRARRYWPAHRRRAPLRAGACAALGATGAEKTGGNPFFAIQFFTALAEEGLLAFDPITRVWQWNMDRIRAKSYTDNVVDLMAGKLKRFSSTTQ